MYSSDLFKNILLNPIKNGANKLYIISGYATSAMAYRHINSLRKQHTQIKIELIIGMTPIDGISRSNHLGFVELMENDNPNDFSCSYLIDAPPIHSKVYTWSKNDSPLCSFVGSANYTQTAFSNNQIEAMAETDPNACFQYFNSFIERTIYCNNSDSEFLIDIYDEKRKEKIRNLSQSSTDIESEITGENVFGLQSMKLSLLGRGGIVHSVSGLNWGQRQGRSQNEAYIRIPANIARTDFFPERQIQFMVVTDDEKLLICSRAQANGKAIHTPQNNSLLGEYFRNRLGLPNGALISTEDLLNYGRTDVIFYKIDEETYFMDFSKQNG